MKRVPGDTHVAVLLGGWSAEREVSLASGAACAAALRRAGFRVTEIDVDRRIAETLNRVAPDVAFNALHGKWGEDGCMSAILETMQIPYSHSGVLASALAMNKEKSKTIFRAAGIPVANSRIVPLEEAAGNHPLPLPYVLKPVAEGSSVGVHIVDHSSNGPASIILEQRELYGDEIMAERFVPGKEITCAVMGDVALDIIDIVPAVGFYDYRAKYAPGGSTHILPAQILQDDYRKVQHYALAAHRALGCRGISRADFRYDDKRSGGSEIVLLEINTQPGMTSTSLVPELATHAGHSFEELVTWMVNDASVNR
jgi:D-alanine-D-alanine ligase